MFGASAPYIIIEALQQARQHNRPEFYRTSEQNSPTAAKAADQSNAPQGAAGQPSSIAPTVPAPHHEEEGSNQTDRGKEEGTEFFVVGGYKLKITDMAIATFTGLLVVVGAVQSRQLRRTISTMERTERRQTRAYVGISGITFDFPHISYLNWTVPDPLPQEGYVFEDKILVTIQNFGESPAYELRITINWLLLPFGVEQPADIVLPELAPLISVSASRVLDKGQIFVGAITVTNMWDFQVADAKIASLFVYGHVFYTDVYGRRWQRDFRHIYEPWRREGERFTPHTGGNDENYIGPRPPKLPA